MAKNLSAFACGARPVLPQAVPADTLNCVAATTSNSDAVIALAADAARGLIISKLFWSYAAAPTGGRLTLADSSGTLVDLDVGAAGPGYLDLNPPLITTPGSALTATLKAGGSGVTGKLNMICWKLD